MKESNISFYSVRTFSLKTEAAVTACIKAITAEESREIGNITFVFCDDNYLLKINKEFLDHDTYTDIITFDYSAGNEIISEIYVSTDRVEENAKKHKQTFEKEMHRVMIHGVLHLCGYNDKLAEEKQIMRDKENHYLSLMA
ncbi:MAG: rRNA maturation RNase YbeY [Bacteroidetes bacterium MED-G21]|nr:MAG: rRNA maturation RNase YbeY [Bacteroidetes bacterium MED-G21]